MSVFPKIKRATQKLSRISNEVEDSTYNMVKLYVEDTFIVKLIIFIWNEEELKEEDEQFNLSHCEIPKCDWNYNSE